MGNPFTLEIFYPDGDPENMRVVTKRGWTGKVFYISRKYWLSGSKQYRTKLEAPGVYILAGGNDDGNDNLQSIYIGHSENLLTRLGRHTDDSNRDFQYIVCATGDDINNVHCRWMEAYLIEQAKTMVCCTLDNKTVPPKPKIKESEMVDIKKFLDDALQIFPIVEVKAFLAAKTVMGATMQQTIPFPPAYHPTAIEQSEIEPLMIMLSHKVMLSNGKKLSISECLLHGYFDENKKFSAPWTHSKREKKNMGAWTASKHGFALGSKSEMWIAHKYNGTRELLLEGSKGKYQELNMTKYLDGIPGVSITSERGGRERIYANKKRYYVRCIPRKVFEAAGFFTPKEDN